LSTSTIISDAGIDWLTATLSGRREQLQATLKAERVMREETQKGNFRKPWRFSG